MTLQQLFLASALCVAPSLSFASGVCSIIGKNASGMVVTADFETEPYSVYVWKDSADQVVHDKSSQRFFAEPYEYEALDDHLGKSSYCFSCAADGKSPLAGTQYTGVFRGRDANSRVRWTCVKGCQTNRTAPKTMDQRQWKC